MSKPEHFEEVEDIAIRRLSGEVSLSEMVEMVTSAIAAAHEQRISKLMVVAHSLTGFAPPRIGRRYVFIREWARAARGVRVALVVRPEMIDREKFGVTVAANAGLVADVFSSEEEAIAWLRSIK